MFIDFCVEIIVKQAYRFFILTLFLSHLLIQNQKSLKFLFIGQMFGFMKCIAKAIEEDSIY